MKGHDLVVRELALQTHLRESRTMCFRKFNRSASKQSKPPLLRFESGFLPQSGTCMRPLLFAFLLVVVMAGAGCSRQLSDVELASQALERGLQAHAAGRLDEAAAAYREVLVHDPRSTFAYYNLGLIEQTLDHPGAAEAYYRLALGIDSNFVSALFNLAILRNEAGATQEAIDLYRQVVALQPDHAEAHFNLGLALRSIGEEAEAQEEIDRAIELNPSLGARVPVTATEGPKSLATAEPTP